MTRLRVEKINTYYGESHMLRDVSLHVGAGETVALLGPQRCRQDDDAQEHRRLAAAAHAEASRSTARSSPAAT